MNSNSPSDSLVHVRKLSLRQHFAENKPVLVIMGLVCGSFFLIGMLAPLIIYGALFKIPALLFPAIIAMFFSGLFVVFFLRNTERMVQGHKQKDLVQIEDRLRKGTSSDVLADLDKVVSINLKLKRQDVADFYSRMAFEIAQSSCDSRPQAIKGQMDVTYCHIASPSYHKSWRYHCVWLFESKGTLHLTEEALLFSGTKYNLYIRLSDITKVELKRHPLWQKPIPMKYIAVTFFEEGAEHCYFLSPADGMCDTVWDINKKVNAWYPKIESAHKAARKALLENDEPAWWS